jgi:hypothetical protein
MALPLALLGADSFGGLLLVLLVGFVIVVFGTFLGVLGALRTFFGAATWQETDGRS